MAQTTDSSSEEEREPVLHPVDRVCELCFGLFMALTFVGAVSAATDAEHAGEDPGRLMFYTALACNLAWGLADAVMYLVRTRTERGRRLSLATALHTDRDSGRGVRLLRAELSGAMRTLVGDAELEAVRARVAALPELPRNPRLTWPDYFAAFCVFALVVLATFPVALPFVLMEAPKALLVSRVLTIVMLFACGLALGRHAGGGGWKSGFGMLFVGVALTAAIIALGG